MLRRAAWDTDDPVYFRVGSETTYRPFDPQLRRAYEQEFSVHGRTALIPSEA